LCIEIQIGCTFVFTIFLVYLFIQRFLQHVSIVYDHHQAVFTYTLTPVFSIVPPYTGQCLHLEVRCYCPFDKINWNTKIYKLKLLKLLKLLKIIKKMFVYYYCLLELLLSFSPPRSLLHQCHYPRRMSIRWAVETSIFELLNNCSELEALFLTVSCDVAVSYFVDFLCVFLHMRVM
jgi:hypothetical protein